MVTLQKKEGVVVVGRMVVVVGKRVAIAVGINFSTFGHILVPYPDSPVFLPTWLWHPALRTFVVLKRRVLMCVVATNAP